MKILILPVLFMPFVNAHADTFGGGAFTIDFVTIGDVGNDDDNTGFGKVDYSYRMGMNEVSRGMIITYNNLSSGPGGHGGPTLTLRDMTSFGGNGANRPVTGLSWNEAARFVNWLNTSNGYSAAYKFTSGGANDDIELWTNLDAGYNADNPFRNANALYFLPSEDEWYKAAYYDPAANGGAGGYWNYALGSDIVPTSVAGGTSAGTAVYNRSITAGPADITIGGGLSPYGTMGQNGNVWEFSESSFDLVNDLGNDTRVIRGGDWNNSVGDLASSFRFGNDTIAEGFSVGFRVAAVPEPSAFLLSLTGILGAAMRRKRG